MFVKIGENMWSDREDTDRVSVFADTTLQIKSLCCLKVYQLKLEVRNPFKVVIYCQNGKISIYCGCGNKRVNITNKSFAYWWPEPSSDGGIDV